MKTPTPPRRLLLVALLASACLSAHAAGPSKTTAGQRELPDWGTVYDQDGDCRFDLKGETLTITVPGSKPHDLSIELGSMNAPRVLQTLNGDLLVKATVAGRFDPGTESTQPDRVGYNGAGLVVMADERNYIELVHGVYQQPGGKVVSYVDIEMRVDGKWVSASKAEDHLIPADKPVHLSLAINDGKVTALLIRDGQEDGEKLDAITIPASWPKKLQVGVVAISTSKKKFTPEFSDFGATE